jgi:predicted amidophosphoribosyltransferase
MAFECRACRAENEPGDSFCHQCGERLQIVCAKCGQPGKPTSRFCSRCGAAFAQQSAKPALREQFDALRSGGGERKYISVLFKVRASAFRRRSFAAAKNSPLSRTS